MNSTRNQTARSCFLAVLQWMSLISILSAVPAFGQEIPVRLSFKFILDASGNRPATGNLNTDAEIDAQIAAGNSIFSRFISELRFEKLEVVDVAGVSQWYSAGPSNTTISGLSAAALADRATYHWRADAVNVYITGADGSGISEFPPNNDIIVVGQGSWNTTVAHEAGHILNLLHTHESDQCGDTLTDNADWTRDDIASNNFGVVYANLTASQQAQVDMTWGNLMSYHDPNNRSMISPCQMDRESTQAYTDRNWMLSKLPVYVDAANGGTHNGSFTEPYQTIQAALSANIFTGELNGNAMVLEQGVYSRPSGTINTPCDIITRKGASTIQDAPPTYSLPYAVEKSTNAAVRQAVLRAQQCDRKGDLAGVIVNLKEAEQHATGREKSVLQLELAQRHRDSGRLEEAENWFKKLAEGADQPALKNHALREMDDMNKKARLQKQQKTGTNSSTLKK